MALIQITAFGIGEEIFPSGKTVFMEACLIKSIAQNVTITLNGGYPLVCDETAFSKKLCEKIEYSGKVYYVAQGLKSITSLCVSGGESSSFMVPGTAFTAAGEYLNDSRLLNKSNYLVYFNGIGFLVYGVNYSYVLDSSSNKIGIKLIDLSIDGTDEVIFVM